MDLSISGQRKQAVQTANAASRTEKKAAETGTLPRKTRTDRQDWSQQALSFLQELNRQDLEKQRKIQEAKQQSKSELDMMEKSLKAMERCRKIASRIMKGDKVPPQDEQYLMEADPDGYKLAIAGRVPKEKPKEWESVLEDEEESGSSSDEGGESGPEAAEASDEA